MEHIKSFVCEIKYVTSFNVKRKLIKPLENILVKFKRF